MARPFVSFSPDSDLLARLGTLRDRALDATTRNPSIRLLQASRRAVDLASHAPGDILATLRTGGQFDLQADQVPELMARAKRTAVETGLHHVAVGCLFLDGAVANTSVRAPLFLAPASIERRGEGFRVVVEPARFNEALGVWLGRHASVGPDVVEAALQIWLHGHDVNDTLSDLASLLDEAGLPVQPEAQWARVTTRTTRHKGGALRLRRHMVLAEFPQADEAIAQDLELLGDGPLPASIQQLLGAPVPDEALPGVDDVLDADRGVVVPANGAQDEALLRARRLTGTVIRGPPGTGKSQLITNILSDAMHHGERALVVCQKQAALEVVQQRLASVGLGNKAVRIQDPVRDRDDAFAVFRRALGQQPQQVSATNLSPRIDETIAALGALVERFGKSHQGRDVRWLYAHAEPGYKPRMKRFKQLRAATYEEVLEAGRAVAAYRDDVQQLCIRHPWKARRNFSSRRVPSQRHLDEVLATLRKILPNPAYVADRQQLEEALSRAGRPTMDCVLEDRFSRGLTGAGEATPETAPALELALRAHALFDSLERALTKPAVDKMRLDAQEHPDRLRRRLGALQKSLDDYDAMVQLDRDLCAHRPTVRQLIVEASRCLGEDAEATLVQEALHVWIRDVESRRPELRGDAFRSYTRLRDRLAQLMQQKRDAQATALAAHACTLDAGVVHHVLAALDSDSPPTLRNLLQAPKLGAALLEAVPCWLMSPEAVSAILPMMPDMFDVVVFDEASQLEVARALPAMARGRRVVVAGDEKQLPPFDLFRSQHDEADVSDLALHARSLLTAAAGTWGVQMLEWHYRSRHQQLVDFSNHAYYDGRLKVAPSLGEAQPLHWHPVPGVLANGANELESSRAVEVAVQELRSGRSVGIVAFNSKQRDAIEAQIERRQRLEPEFASLWGQGDEPAFVKNIENVQGDERDVIVFSTTYGPDANGRVSARFGSFNLPGGEHRLNVALTRARHAMHIVSSLNPDELSVDNSVNLGPRHLKAFLRYARACSAGQQDLAKHILSSLGPTSAEVRPASVTPLQQRIRDVLEDAGYACDLQVGVAGHRIDVAVRDPRRPSRYCVAIECDGDNFRHARGARERDVARPRALENRGWQVERVWARNWYRHPQKEAARLLAALAPYQKTTEPVAA